MISDWALVQIHNQCNESAFLKKKKLYSFLLPVLKLVGWLHCLFQRKIYPSLDATIVYEEIKISTSLWGDTHTHSSNTAVFRIIIHLYQYIQCFYTSYDKIKYKVLYLYYYIWIHVSKKHTYIQTHFMIMLKVFD